MASSPWEGLRNGDEDVASPFLVEFLRCPRRPLGVKIIRLALSVPALLLAGDCVMRHSVFGHQT
jgi:hypothetical protein